MPQEKLRCKKQALISVETLNNEEQSVLHIRVAPEIRSECALETISTFHKDKYIDAYSSKQKTCCDIFEVHKKPVHNLSLRIISLDWYKKPKSCQPSIKLTLGKTVFCNCRLKIMQILDASERAASSSDSKIELLELEMVRDNSLMTLNESFQNLGESPIKLQGITLASRVSYGKRKLTKINETVEAELSKVLRVNVDKSLTESSNCNVDSQTTDQESLHIMIGKIKEKTQCSNSMKAVKMQILTLAPNNWPKKKFLRCLQ